jgi:hypothetical protein
LDRGDEKKAGILTAPAWVLASQSEGKYRAGRTGELTLDESQLDEAVLTTAFHELWSERAPCDRLYDEVGRQLEMDGDDSFGAIVENARASVRKASN